MRLLNKSNKQLREQYTATTRVNRLLLTILLVGSIPFSWGNTPPNIVFILADNQSAEALSVYGNKDVSLPNLEALARRGVSYTQAFAVSGMCSPTRATLLSGLMPSQHGLHNALHDEWVDYQEPAWSAIQEFDSLPQALSRSGYQTAMIGKWHIGDPKVNGAGFDHWVALPYGHTRDFWHNQLVINKKIVSIEGQHIVDVLADKARDYIQQVDTQQPFFLQLSIDGPYALPPTNAGPARNKHYPALRQQVFQSMPIEAVNDNILQRLQGPFNPGQSIEKGIEGMSLDEIWNSLLYRTIRMQSDQDSYANFLSQNRVVDDAVGVVWKSLVDRKLDKNTIIIYSADQGNFFGQHGTWGHTIWFWPSRLYDTAMRVPLIIVDPTNSAKAGTSSQQLVAQYDIAPTIMAMAQSPMRFKNSPGSNIYSDQSSVTNSEKAVFFEQEESRGIRTARYAYWKRNIDMGEPMLFDMEKDPEQSHNIYPQHINADFVKKLDQQLDTFFATYSDPQYNLWEGGVSKGTTPNPKPWIKQNPLPWIKKLWDDYWTTH